DGDRVVEGDDVRDGVIVDGGVKRLRQARSNGDALSANSVADVGPDGIAVSPDAALRRLERNEESRRPHCSGRPKRPCVQRDGIIHWDEGALLAGRSYRVSIKDRDVRGSEIGGGEITNIDRPVKRNCKTVDQGPAIRRGLIV